MAEAEAPTDQQVVDVLRATLREVDLAQTTERALRKQLQEHFGVDMTDRKPLIRQEVERFLDEQEPLEEDEEGGQVSAEEEVEVAATKKKGTGFSRPCALSEPLQAFLGEEMLARSEVVKRIWDYIKANDLQDPSNRRKIIVDERLGTFLTSPVDMFKMNTQLTKHIFQPEAGGSPAAPRKRKSSTGSKDEGGTQRKQKSKTSSKDDSGGGNRRSSNGFTKPISVTPELGAWCGGRTEISRPELTKHFWAYIKEQGLQDPDDKRYTICDDTLQALTGQKRFLSFGFMKHLNQHLLKA